MNFLFHQNGHTQTKKKTSLSTLATLALSAGTGSISWLCNRPGGTRRPGEETGVDPSDFAPCEMDHPLGGPADGAASLDPSGTLSGLHPLQPGPDDPGVLVAAAGQEPLYVAGMPPQVVSNAAQDASSLMVPQDALLDAAAAAGGGGMFDAAQLAPGGGGGGGDLLSEVMHVVPPPPMQQQQQQQQLLPSPVTIVEQPHVGLEAPGPLSGVFLGSGGAGAMAQQPQDFPMDEVPLGVSQQGANILGAVPSQVEEAGEDEESQGDG